MRMPLLFSSVIYALVGMILFMLGYKVFDWISPMDLDKELAEDQNIAAGIVVAGIFIGLAIIIASAIG